MPDFGGWTDMSTSQVIVQGVLKVDGTLELDEQPTLPPGRVQVTVTMLSASSANFDPLAELEAIWAEREALGLVPRSAAEIDAELRAARSEWEERQQGLDRVQEENQAVTSS